MIIDCESCAMQHTSACDDCIATVLLAQTEEDEANSRVVELDDTESAALENLARAGLVAPIRLVPRRRSKAG